MEKLLKELKDLQNELKSGDLKELFSPNHPELRSKLKAVFLDMAYGVVSDVYDEK